MPIDVFLGALRAYQVRTLVDIRSIPKSRHNPQFAQDNLFASLRDAGIACRWQRSLGGLRHARKDSINTGWRNSSFRGYADYMQTPAFAAALDELLAAEDLDHTAIMCAEAVPWRCHRSLVADALTLRGVPVTNIFCDAKGHSHTEPHALTSFARTDGQHLWYPAEGELFPGYP
nr:DUF488 domain-containing protein [Paracidobacterium acidisoli]